MVDIGFIGLGHMGAPMAKNLIKAGHCVSVYDISSTTFASFRELGAQIAATPAELAQHTKIIFTMLQTGEQVQQVCADPSGIYAQMQPGSLHIDSSSIDVATTRALHELAQAKQIKSLDAPVSGGVMGASNATLTFMVGGETAVYEEALPILQSLGKKIIHAGAAGNGQLAKICNNMILAINMIAVSEAFTLGKQLGLEPSKLFEIASNASGQCWAMTSYCPVPGVIDNVPANNHYQPGFPAPLMLKDLRLSQDAAHSIALETPLGSVATHLYEAFVSQGGSTLDFSAIIKMIDSASHST